MTDERLRASEVPEGETIYDVNHRELMLPVVRIAARNAAGSGTVIYSRETSPGSFSTYILTNHHVVEGLIEIKDQWSSLLKRKVKSDVLSHPEVHFFEYKWRSRNNGARAVEAEIIAYDVDEDLALVHLMSDSPVPAVVKLLPRGAEEALRATMPVYAVGAGMGASPVITGGMLSQFGTMIDNREFWSSTAPTIFGNSGGALFLKESNQFIGVPSRLSVNIMGVSADAITHLSYAIPITRVYEFFEEQMMSFIYDDSHNEKDDLRARDDIRKSDEERRSREEAEGKTEAPTAEFVVPQ